MRLGCACGGGGGGEGGGGGGVLVGAVINTKNTSYSYLGEQLWLGTGGLSMPPMMSPTS